MRIKAIQAGVTILARGTCLACGETCLVCGDGLSSCCQQPVRTFKTGKIQKIGVTAKRKKKYLKIQIRKEILARQNNRCYWCGVEFGRFAERNGEIYRLDPVWDHYIPYCYTGSNKEDQYVASCRICNSFKHSRMITTDEEEWELKAFLRGRWEKLKWHLILDENEVSQILRQ